MEAESASAPGNGAAPAADSSETPAAELAALRKELEDAKTKATEYLDGLQRERASFANFKRRVEREQADAQQQATTRIITRYLDVFDDFERAMRDKPGEGAGPETLAKWAEGVSLIYRKFQNVLDAEGIARIEADGKPFDPVWHEAVVHAESDAHPSGHVVEVLRHGYKLGDRVIRPALVKVAK